jgi:hypothetical protein
VRSGQCANFESVRCCRWLYWQLIFIRVCASKAGVLHLEKAERDKLADKMAIEGWDAAKAGLCHHLRVSDLSGLLLLIIMTLLSNSFIKNLKFLFFDALQTFFPLSPAEFLKEMAEGSTASRFWKDEGIGSDAYPVYPVRIQCCHTP